MHSAGRLEIDESLEFQRREQRFQRIGWIVALGLLIACLCGVFGRGPASYTSKAAADGAFWVEYNQFGRFQAEDEIVIRVHKAGSSAGEFQVWFSRSLHDALRPRFIIPPPRVATQGEESVIYHFESTGSSGSRSIHVIYEPLKYGTMAGAVGLVGHGSVELSQFVYP